jgi:hypothetical protein
MSRIAWTFYDPNLDVTYSLPINPNNEQSSRSVQKSQGFAVAAGRYDDPSATPSSYNNVTLIYEGPDEINRFSFSGTLYDQTQYNNFVYWSEKTNMIHITDDLDRTFEVYIVSFSTERRRSRKFPWKHNYTMETIVKGVIEE